MGPVRKKRTIQILSLLLGLLVLGLPACQKAKMTKKERTRTPRVQQDQDTAAPGPAPQRTIPQPTHVSPTVVQPTAAGQPVVVVPTSSSTITTGEGEGLPVDGQSQPVKPHPVSVYQHPTSVSGANSRVVVYKGDSVIDTCKKPDCREPVIEEVVPPAPAPVVEKKIIPPPVVEEDPCEQKKKVVDPCAEAEQPVVDNCPKVTCPEKEPLPPPPPAQPVYESKSLEFFQPEGPVTQRVDILFVMDTSPSIYHERKWIVEQLPKLINQLPGGDNGTSYKIGVLPAHSPDSQYSARLYSSDPNDPLVLGNKGKGRMTLDEITKALVKKMEKIPKEKGNDAGELGLLSLNNFLTSDQAKRLQQEDQFLRQDAALMVIFVADENDICYKYKEGEQPAYDERYHSAKYKAVEFNGIKGFDPVEVEAHKKYCAPLGDVPERTVYETLRQVKGDMPLRASGIVYTNIATVPHEKGTEQYFDENEIGRGYLELMALTGSTAMDMALGSFDVAMEFLGKFTTHSLKYIDKFQIPQSEVVAIVEKEGSQERRALVDVQIQRADGTRLPVEILRIIFDEKSNEVTVLPQDTPINGVLYEPQPLDKITVTWQVEKDPSSASEAVTPPPSADDGIPEGL